MSLKKIVGFIITAASLFCLSSVCFSNPWVDMNITYDYQTHKYSAEGVYLYVNGNKVENLPMPPIILKGYTLVPAREVFEPLGAIVDWKKEQEEVLVAYKDNIISIGINDQFVNINGKEIPIPVPAKIINNKTMIPTRFIAEALGLTVSWDNEKRIVGISSPIEQTTEQTTEQITEATTERASSEPSSVNENNANSSNINKTNSPIGSFNSIVCKDGTVTITADLPFGDYSQPKTSKKNTVEFNVFHAGSSLNNVYKFDDKYFKKLTVISVKKENSDIVRFIFEMNNDEGCYAKITNDGKNFVVKNGKQTFSQPSSSTNQNNNSSSSNQTNSTNPVNPGKLPSMMFTSSFGINSSDGRIFINKSSANFNISTIKHEDNYSKLLYTIDLECDLSSSVPNGKYSVSSENSALNYIEAQTVSGKTKLTFSEKNIYAFKVEQDNSYIYITPVSPKSIYPKIVVVDAGHGYDDPGAQANGIDEKNLNLDIALKFVALLEKDPNIKVYATRLDDTFYTRPERANFANSLGDMFISIHANSFTGAAANGTEVWYYPHSNDSSIGLTCKYMAEVFQKNLIKHLGSVDRGVKSTDYDVLTLTKIPAVLCETGFITNIAEAQKLKTDSYRQSAAQAMYDSVVYLFNSYSPKR